MAQRLQTRYRSLEQKLTNRVDDRQVVDLTEDAARGVEDMAAANDRVAVDDMVAADGTVEVLVRIAHYLLMQKCTFTVHHVCVCRVLRVVCC